MLRSHAGKSQHAATIDLACAGFFFVPNPSPPSYILASSLPPNSSQSRTLVSNLGLPEMSTSAAARKKKGSTPSSLDVAVATPAHTLGRVGFSAPTALCLGCGSGSVLTALSLGHGVGSVLTACSLRRGGGSAAVATHPTISGLGKGTVTVPLSIDRSSIGAFPISSLSIDGFLFPSSSSLDWCDWLAVIPCLLDLGIQ